MGLSTLIKQTYLQLIGGTAPTGAASSSGDISQMIKYLIANAGSTPQNRWGLPGRFTAPIDVTISGNTTLTERINYFKNLTINNGIVLTGLAGGTIIVVEETLTLSNATSQISVNGLGGKGATGVTNAVAPGGYGGGAWGFDLTTLTLTQGQFLSVGAISASNPYARQRLQTAMGSGGAGMPFGGAGGAYPATSRAMFAGTTVQLAQWELVLALLELILERPTDDANGGGIGGGGGGAGGSGAAPGTGGVAGANGGKGGTSTGAAGAGGGGGSGFGGGGGGADSNSSSVASGAGGRGGGVLLVIAKTINNAGIITADGANGSNATAGGGGGGGGGAAVLAYESTSGSGVGTVRANGGSAGTGGSLNGGAGGAGLAASFKIRSGS